MNITLTGARGFIGTYFVNKYNVKYVIKSFSFFNDNLEELELQDCDSVVHLSALVHQMGGASRDEYEKVNVVQTLELAKKAKLSSVKHFIFMSSVKVYGEESASVYNESTECNPQDDYGRSKLKAENELLKLEDENFKVSIIRTPIVYGYGVKANIKSLISLVKRVPILPFGKIDNQRSMVYIGNLCHLIDQIIEHDEKGLFLASDDSPVSTTKLIETISKELSKTNYLLAVPFFPYFLKLIKPAFYQRLYGSLEIENKQTREKLKLSNPYSLEEGVRYMIKGEEI
ncbi:MAG: NAD-dependent epimerase/dehydratase family protein [Campylobacterota bacterium]|nr:NAD-dependent epimerase/dehydratase family protein [Campylobacterota bacterium]